MAVCHLYAYSGGDGEARGPTNSLNLKKKILFWNILTRI
jgi:hypothetical protein